MGLEISKFDDASPPDDDTFYDCLAEDELPDDGMSFFDFRPEDQHKHDVALQKVEHDKKLQEAVDEHTQEIEKKEVEHGNKLTQTVDKYIAIMQKLNAKTARMELKSNAKMTIKRMERKCDAKMARMELKWNAKMDRMERKWNAKEQKWNAKEREWNAKEREWNAKMARMEQQLRKVKEQSKKDLERMQGQITNLRNENKTLRAKVKSLEEKNDKLTKELDVLKQEFGCREAISHIKKTILLAVNAHLREEEREHQQKKNWGELLSMRNLPVVSKDVLRAIQIASDEINKPANKFAHDDRLIGSEFHVVRSRLQEKIGSLPNMSSDKKKKVLKVEKVIMDKDKENTDFPRKRKRIDEMTHNDPTASPADEKEKQMIREPLSQLSSLGQVHLMATPIKNSRNY